MRQYLKETALRWKEFRAGHPELAAELSGFILSICSDMAAIDRKRQVEAMLASDQFKSLRKKAMDHAEALGIREDTDKEFALWIRTICFCDVLRQEHAA